MSPLWCWFVKTKLVGDGSEAQNIATISVWLVGFAEGLLKKTELSLAVLAKAAQFVSLGVIYMNGFTYGYLQ